MHGTTAALPPHSRGDREVPQGRREKSLERHHSSPRTLQCREEHLGEAPGVVKVVQCLRWSFGVEALS